MQLDAIKYIFRKNQYPHNKRVYIRVWRNSTQLPGIYNAHRPPASTLFANFALSSPKPPKSAAIDRRRWTADVDRKNLCPDPTRNAGDAEARSFAVRRREQPALSLSPVHVDGCAGNRNSGTMRRRQECIRPAPPPSCFRRTGLIRGSHQSSLVRLFFLNPHF